MNDLETEDQQVEEFKRWWKENGKAAMLGAVLSFCVIFGGKMYMDHQEQQRMEASIAFDIMSQALTDKHTDSVLSQGQQIVTNYPDTPYAALAALALAKQHVDMDELAAAQIRLQWVIDHEQQPDIVHVAQLRLARVLFADAQEEQALTLLTQAHMETYAPIYQELRGDIYVAQNKRDQARDAYTLALEALNEQDDRQLLTMKLDDLGE